MSGHLPALETVRTAGFLVDTSTDGLARDIFIWWTERFEYMGVDLVDGEGVIWMYEDEKNNQGKEDDIQADQDETVMEGEQGDVGTGQDKELKEGSGPLGETSVQQVKKKEDTQDVNSKVHQDGSPMEVLYLPSDCPTYVHKIDPVERAAKDAGREIELEESGLD